jgi:hypothetical protein
MARYGAVLRSVEARIHRYSSAPNFTGREAEDEVLLLAKVRTPIASMVVWKHPILRHNKPFATIPRAPATFTVYEGSRRPTVRIVTAARIGIVRWMPALVNVVHF